MSSVGLPAGPSDGQPGQQEGADPVDAAVNALQQRELLEPVLLLSAGYLAMPFLLGQLRLLLTPLLFLLEDLFGGLLGRSLPEKGSRHDCPS